MTGKPLRILVIGGYGIFGSRLTRLLANEEALTLLVAGRSLPKATAHCHSVGGRATLQPVFFDRDGAFAATIESLRPDIVVDAAGPFQHYGMNAYRIAEAAISAGSDYIDFADATDFVCGIDCLDQLAKHQGRFALSGASTFPALTAAVVRHLAVDIKRLTGIEAGVAPSPHAEVGLSVFRALTAYAGHPLRLLKEGREVAATALVDSRHHIIAPTSVKPMRDRLFSLIDVPELRLMPQEWPDLKDIWFGAGIAPVIQHRSFVLLAWLAKSGLLRSPTSLAPLLYWIRRHATWGEHRGGMYVVVEGASHEGKSVQREWDLIAEADDGPFIPAMATAAIIRKFCRGFRPMPGARSALRELEYADFANEFLNKRIVAAIRDVPHRD